MKAKTIITKPFNAVRAAIALIVLILFFCIESVLLAVYYLVETPLRFILNKLEALIKYITKYIK